MYYATQNCLTEWSFVSSKTYLDPFNEVTLDVIFTDPNGEEHQVPAFWCGEQTWRVRYTSPKVGTHRWRSTCSDTSNSDLHGQEGGLVVKPYEVDPDEQGNWRLPLSRAPIYQDWVLVLEADE